MKTIILSCFFLMAGISATVAQTTSMTVQNNTNCSYEVQLVSEWLPCSSPCSTAVVCVPGMTTVTIAPPCSSSWDWDQADVTPVIDNCTTCGSATVSVGTLQNCLSLPASASGSHCAGCSNFTVTMGPTAVQIN